MFQLGCASRACFQNELLSGLTVALALVPEAVAFAFVAGVDPLVGLYAAFMVGLLAAIIVVSLLAIGLGLDTATVGDLASIEGSFPAFHFPAVPLSLGTLIIILPYSFILAAI